LLPLVGIDASPARPKNIYRFLGALQDLSIATYRYNRQLMAVTQSIPEMRA
jgi:hypothetical protein